MTEATIEDLAIEVRSSREPDGVGRRACLSAASCATAEESEWRWRYKSDWERGHFPKPIAIISRF